MKILHCTAAALLLAASPVFAENLFQGDTGAEAGIEFVSGGGLVKTRLPVFHDTSVFQEGKGSLRVEWNPAAPSVLQNTHPAKYFGIDMPELERDKEYTVSFYAKASADDFPVGVHLFTRQGWDRNSSYYLKARLSREWKRHSFTFKPKVPRSFFSTAYSLNIMMIRGKNVKPVTVWFDAFQLERGRKATPYQAPVPAAAELQLKSSAPMNIIGKDDKIEAAVNALALRDSGKLTLNVTVADWEGKVRKEFSEEFRNSLTKTYRLPSGRYGWFDVHLQVKSGEKVLSDLTKNYLVVRPPVKIAKGMRPFCGGIADIVHMNDPAAFAANRAVGVARFQVRAISLPKHWDGEPRKGELDFTLTDWQVEQARKNGMAVKMMIAPFDWKTWHFPKEEVDEMKRCGSRHTMFDFRHRKFWNEVVSQVLDRYGDKIDTLEFGGEDNGRLGISPYFKKKYPQGVQKDRNGTPWVVAGPAFDALCTLVTDACRMARKRYPNLRVGAIRPSQGRPGNPWFFVWKMFEKIGKEFNTFPVDTYSMVPYTIGPGYSKETRYSSGGADSRPFTMEHAKRIIAKYGCGQDVYLSETGTELFSLFVDYSPDRREEAEYQVQDMLAARAAGFSAYDVFHSVDADPQDGKCWSMVLKNGPQMRAGAYSAVAQILENVTEGRWIKPDSVTRIALFRKADGSGRAAVYAQPGYTMYVPEGIQVFDFMGNEYEPDAKRILPLSGAAWYFSAPKYETLAAKLADPQIDQTDYCKLAFRHISGKAGLIRVVNNSNQKSVMLECIIDAGGKELRKNVPVMAGSWNSFRVPLDGASGKLTVKYRRQGIDQKYLAEEFKLPEVTSVRAGNEPVSELGRVESKNQILPNEPWTPWSGVKDLGVVLYGSWTDTELKLKAAVTDDLHHPSKNPDAPWTGDSIQIAIDPKNDGTFFKSNGRSIGPDDLEFALRLGKDGQVTKVISSSNKEIKMDIQAVRDEKAGTTVYEIRIPWSGLGVKPHDGMVFGLSAVVFDDDTGQGQEYRGMIGGGVAGGKNPALYRRFILKGPEGGTASAELAETPNLLKNPDFSGRGKFWKLRYHNLQDSIRDENGKKIIRMEMAAANKRGGNVFSQTVIRPQGGSYVYSVEVSPSRKFARVQVVIMYSDDNGKTVYPGARMKSAEYPKPGEWGRIIGEVKIPAGRKHVGFAVEVRDSKAEGYILIRNPQMTLREE